MQPWKVGRPESVPSRRQMGPGRPAISPHKSLGAGPAHRKSRASDIPAAWALVPAWQPELLIRQRGRKPSSLQQTGSLRMPTAALPGRAGHCHPTPAWRTAVPGPVGPVARGVRPSAAQSPGSGLATKQRLPWTTGVLTVSSSNLRVGGYCSI